jgi:hypothetical protein
MKNITISVDDTLASAIRVEAAKRGMSMSRYLASLVERDRLLREEPSVEEQRQLRMSALERFLSGPKLAISENGRMPTADERNARR